MSKMKYGWVLAVLFTPSAMDLSSQAQAAPLQICNSEATSNWIGELGGKLSGAIGPSLYFGALQHASVLSPQHHPTDDPAALWVTSVLNGPYVRGVGGLVSVLEPTLLDETVNYVRENVFKGLSPTESTALVKLRGELFGASGNRLPSYQKYVEIREARDKAKKQLENEPGNTILRDRLNALEKQLADHRLLKDYDNIEFQVAALESRVPSLWTKRVLDGLKAESPLFHFEYLSGQTKETPVIPYKYQDLSALSFFNVKTQISFSECGGFGNLTSALGEFDLSITSVPFSFSPAIQNLFDILSLNSASLNIVECKGEGSVAECFMPNENGKASKWIMASGVLLAKDILVTADNDDVAKTLRQAMGGGRIHSIGNVDIVGNTWLVSEDRGARTLAERITTYASRGKTEIVIPGYMILGVYYRAFQPK